MLCIGAKIRVVLKSSLCFREGWGVETMGSKDTRTEQTEKSHDLNPGCFLSVEMLFAAVVWLKYILLLVRFSYPSSRKRRLKPDLARLFCVAFSI